MPSKLPVALTIAGSDSGGGAGIQADLKTFHAFGVFGTSAITAITVQNTRGVFGVHSIPPETVQSQIRVVAEDLKPSAIKTGVLATAELVRSVARSVAEHGLGNYVLDPVMVATSGHRLIDEEAEQTIIGELLPLATLVTPNLDEASILYGSPVQSRDDMRAAAEALVARGARAALIKGGHMQGAEVLDILFDGTDWREWRRPKLETRSTHGTGCTLSAAITAGLAHGRPLRVAVENGLDYVNRAMREAPGLGGGHGPLNHLVPVTI